jgi:hypothetical protein
MGKIQALNMVEEGEFQTCDTSLLNGMDAFAFGYKVKWPVSLANIEFLQQGHLRTAAAAAMTLSHSAGST